MLNNVMQGLCSIWGLHWEGAWQSGVKGWGCAKIKQQTEASVKEGFLAALMPRERRVLSDAPQEEKFEKPESNTLLMPNSISLERHKSYFLTQPVSLHIATLRADLFLGPDIIDQNLMIQHTCINKIFACINCGVSVTTVGHKAVKRDQVLPFWFNSSPSGA